MHNNTQDCFRVAIAGRGFCSFSVLESLLAKANIEIAAVFLGESEPEIVQQFQDLSASKNIELHQTEALNRAENVARLEELQIDLLVVLHWKYMLSEEVINTARHGAINLHSGMLPRYRGNATLAWAMLSGEKEFGVTVHFMDPKEFDSGAIICQQKVPISDTDTILDLDRACHQVGAELVPEAVDLVLSGSFSPEAQDVSEALYCYPRLPRDGEIDWNCDADRIAVLVRAANHPHPGAYSFFSDVSDGNRIKKLVIRKSHVKEHEMNFLSLAGHLLKLDGGENWAVVCGDKKLLVLEEIEIDGEPVVPKEYFRSIRQRLGLDTETILKALSLFQ